MKNYDFIIVGQGIAGSILGYTLMEKYHKNVLIVDNNHYRSASKIAAGIYNPITGKRRVKTWMAEEIFPFMQQFYQLIEDKFHIKLLYDSKVYRPFDSIFEQNEWAAQTRNNENFAHICKPKVDLDGIIDDRYGGIVPLLSGWMDCDTFLETMKYYFIENDAYQRHFFESEHLTENVDNEQKIIFCEGFQAAHSPLWSWLPWLLAKGEIITVKIENTQIKNIINKSVFICPTTITNQYHVGSTFAWDGLETDQTTKEAYIELQNKLSKTIKIPFEIINHQARIRPTVQSRRPFIGMHPKNKNLGIFNGFGSKSVSLAPYFAQQYCEFMLNNEPLPQEVDINQYNFKFV